MHIAYRYLNICIYNTLNDQVGAMWLCGTVLSWRPKVCEFDPGSRQLNLFKEVGAVSFTQFSPEILRLVDARSEPSLHLPIHPLFDAVIATFTYSITQIYLVMGLRKFSTTLIRNRLTWLHFILWRINLLQSLSLYHSYIHIPSSIISRTISFFLTWSK